MCPRASLAIRLILALGLVVSLDACATPARNSAQGPIGTADRLKLADAAAQSGNSGLAISLYLRAMSDPRLDTTGRLHAADMLVAFGRTGSAEAALTSRLEGKPPLSGADEAAVRRALARLHIIAGKPAQAVMECDALLQRRPGDLAAKVDKAVALDLLGHHAEAQALYRQALKVAPDDAAVRSDLALSVALQGHITEAQAVAAPLQAQPDLPDRVKTDLGLLYAAGDNPATAAQWLNGRSPTDTDVVLLVDAMRARATAGKTP